jgi:hypothetical protein
MLLLQLVSRGSILQNAGLKVEEVSTNLLGSFGALMDGHIHCQPPSELKDFGIS